MIILRMKANNTITTFTMNNISEANTAAAYIMRTNAAGFIANAESVESVKGQIVRQWDHGTKWDHSSSYVVKSGAYSDYIVGRIGTEEYCRNKALEVNERATCWADKTAKVEQIAGPVWQVLICDPYKD